MIQEKLKNIVNNLQRVAWGIDPGNRIGIVGGVSNHVVNGRENGIYVVDVVNRDPFVGDEDYIVDQFYANKSELDKLNLEVGMIVTWGLVLPFLSEVCEADKAIYESEVEVVKNLYQKYLSDLADMNLD